MAGPLGASAPLLTSPALPVTSRTARVFGAVHLAVGYLAVIASRRAAECTGVLLHVSPFVAGELQPAQARILARSLIEAAAAVEQAQRRPVFTRQGGAA